MNNKINYSLLSANDREMGPTVAEQSVLQDLRLYQRFGSSLRSSPV